MSKKTAGDGFAVPEGSRDLLLRVAATPQFQKSKRLRDLLLYLGEKSLQTPNCTLREQDIGVDVLGRAPDYDTSHDTLVRVQVSQLRKKLQEYFAGDGHGEALIIDIPKGSYVPVFRSRSEAPAPAEPEYPQVRRGSNRKRVLVCGAAAIAAVAGLLVWGVGWARPVQSARGRYVEAFFTQVFGNRQSTNVVLSDVTLINFQKLIGRPVPLSEYESREFDRLAELYIKDPVPRSLAREFVNRVTTSVSDVQVARDFAVIAAEKGLNLGLVSARDLSSSFLATQNTVLLGSLRANPWVGLFEDKVNFQTEYQESPPSMRFVNKSPLAGEPAAFQAEWRRSGYCRVCLLPNPRHTGNVLLISGSDVISTEAGGRFVTSEESLRNLRTRLGVRDIAPYPYFEVLLKTQVVNSTVPWFDLVSCRKHRDEAEPAHGRPTASGTD